jgi:MFS family permease
VTNAPAPTPAAGDEQPIDARSWRRVAAVLFAIGWGANHFAPLLPVYRRTLGLDTAAPALLFGVYALGLLPGLLVAGPLSDRLGRRVLVRPSALAALIASGLLGAFGSSYAALLAGRFAYGLATGGAMSPGAVWVSELSQDAGPGVGARRATIALSAGFGTGALVTGMLAQWLPWPTVTPYVVHVAALSLAIFGGMSAPETRAPRTLPGPLLRLHFTPSGGKRFVREVLPMAPFVFGFPTVAFAGLPPLLLFAKGQAPLPAPLALTGMLSGVTLLTGVLAQPFTRRYSPEVTSRLGLLFGAAGLGVGALAAAFGAPLLLVLAAPLLGAGYGICMTSGLRLLEAVAPPETRGGLTGLYYVLTYLGFAAPWLLALAVRVVPAAWVLGAAGLHAALTAGWFYWLQRGRERDARDRTGIGA